MLYVLDARCSMLDARCSMLDARCLRKFEIDQNIMQVNIYFFSIQKARDENSVMSIEYRDQI
jgi:hypothetical protein